jgi:hypothetical protein
MSINPDIPHEFRASIFPDYVLIVTANAVISAQYVERVLNGICLILKTDGLRFSIEDFMSGDAARTRQTLGMIEKQLRKTNLFEPSFSERLLNFTRRRNRVVHGLFADYFKSRDEINIDSQNAQKYVEECEWVAQEGTQLVEVGFGIYRALGEVFLASNPNQPQIDELLSVFDEFHEVGTGSIAHKFRPHLALKGNGGYV